MILVAGAAGFVGRNLIKELTAQKLKVRCLVRDPAKASKVLGPSIELSAGNILEPSTIIDAITPEVTAVVNLVGILMETRKASFGQVHVEGVSNIVSACQRKGVKRLIHISALGTRDNARSRYHRTKREAELLIVRSGLEYTVFRPSIMFGAEDLFTNRLAGAIRLSPVVAVPGSGRNLMQCVFVKDVARALALSLTLPETRGKIYEIAGPERLSFDLVIDNIAHALGKKVKKVHVPMSMMKAAAIAAEIILPKPPITRDALLMLEEDNVTDNNALPRVFGIRPVSFLDGIKTYLKP